MNKKTMIAAGVLTTFVLGVGAGVFADSSLTEIRAYLDPAARVNVQGKAVALKDEQGNEVTPLKYDNSLYFPIRGVAQSLGYEVYWDDKSHSVLIGEQKSDYLTFRENEKLILDKYGYTLRLPSSLGGKVRPTVWPAEAVENGIRSGKLSQHTVSAADVLYLPQNPTSPASLMATIEVIRQTDWAKDQHDDKDQVLGSKGDYVYILHGVSQNPFDASSGDFPIYQQIADQLEQSQYGLTLLPAIHADEAVVSQLIGKWTESRKGTLMELTADGVLYRAGVAVGNYLILDSSHIKIVSDGQINTVTYQVDGDSLTMAEQSFKKMN
ncbi:stalk domain-containing protein [Paenibacillus ginsengarvi]|uniref:Copper amine oxidase-like N-terminal domain-containing protein n=1 Tax=Paenibacillus ginsengarvi TaxID=400777 RepID=A0A3B0BG43_9BACL|nr:stalk domain-containing protein [Paenibacillus ginsengarvi]RKN72373.1 hypothetical protein D7M11_28240 [Paenibacillus ginsengarvi]